MKTTLIPALVFLSLAPIAQASDINPLVNEPVETTDLAEEEKITKEAEEAGIDVKNVDLPLPASPTPEEPKKQAPGQVGVDDRPWNTVVRVMGLYGYLTRDESLSPGGEAELTTNLLRWKSGFLRRMIGLGATYLRMRDIHFAGASVIYRMFEESSLAEPEARFRIGHEAKEGSLGLGLNVGMRYPFTLENGPHWAGYAEIGGLWVTRSEGKGAVWGAAGVAFHF